MFTENPSYGKEMLYGFGREAAYGTPMMDASGICRLDNIDSVTIDRGIKIHTSKTGGSKDPLMTDAIPTVSGSMATITIVGKANQYTMPYWAKAFFQYGAGGVYSFFSTHPTTPIASMTFFVKDPVTGRDQVYKGCVVKSFKMSAEKGDDDLVKLELELQGKGSGLVNQTVTTSASWKVSGSFTDHFGMYGISDCTHLLGVNGGVQTAVAIQGWNVSLVYDELTQENPDGVGLFTDVGFVGRNGCTVELTCLPDETTEDIVGLLETSSRIQFNIAGHLKLMCTALVNKVEPSLDGLTKVVISGDIKSVGGATMVTIQ